MGEIIVVHSSDKNNMTLINVDLSYLCKHQTDFDACLPILESQKMP